MSGLLRRLRPAVEDPGACSMLRSSHRLRAYQMEPARAIARSVAEGEGRSFAVVFARQSGKDEMLAQLLTWLLVRRQQAGGTAVVAAPTLQPQSVLSRDRLRDRLRDHPLTAGRWSQREGMIVEMGRASVRFSSASPTAHARGQTADLLLVANEAQDIDPDVWDAVYAPMTASTAATTVYMGTVWDRRGLLHRQVAYLSELQAADGVQRVYRVPWRRVADELPAYGRHVEERIAQLGAAHPFVRTEYELIELDSEAGLFPPARQAQLAGEHARQRRASPGRVYALLVDVAGEEEDGAGVEGWAAGSRRDATALTVVEVEAARGAAPVYRVVDRMAWVGKRHVELHRQIVDLARNVWKAAAVVVDATGIGAGLAAWLKDELAGGSRSIPVVAHVFGSASKSAMGWELVGLIDGGRLKEYARDGDRLTDAFWLEIERTRYEVLAGPGRLLRWGVPAAWGHDDLVMSLGLVTCLEGLDLRPRTAAGSNYLTA